MSDDKSIYVNEDLLCEDVKEATTLFQKALGRMFTTSIPEELGLVFPFDDSEPVAIHMLFVFYSLGAIWVDDNEVVAVRKLPPFIGRHSTTADTVIEVHPSKIDEVDVDDKIEIK